MLGETVHAYILTPTLAIAIPSEHIMRCAKEKLLI